MEPMQGKVIVITGGTSGIGQAAAMDLAGMGARLILIARDAERAKATLAQLRKKSSSSAQDVAHGVYWADLSRVAEVKRVGPGDCRGGASD